jgi:hypothetical protein
MDPKWRSIAALRRLTSAAMLPATVGFVAYGFVPESSVAARAHSFPVVAPAPPEPTTLGVTLDSDGESGPAISVPDGGYVSASSALAGTNALSARGTVTYRVYSDSSCTTEVASAGARRVDQGIDSRALRLTPGTYYWQASYAGDEANVSSVSPCGATVETVQGVPLPSSCTGIGGLARFDTEEGPLVLREHLSTNLGERQRLYVWWPGARRLRVTRLLGAWCVARPRADVFRGVAEAKLDGVTGYLVHFTIIVSRYGEPSLRLHVRGPGKELVLSDGGAGPSGTQTLF